MDQAERKTRRMEEADRRKLEGRWMTIYSHGELAEFGLDAAVPHAHPGEGRADVPGAS